MVWIRCRLPSCKRQFQSTIHPARGLRHHIPVVGNNTTTPRNHLLYPPTHLLHPRHGHHFTTQTSAFAPETQVRKSLYKSRIEKAANILRSKVSSCRTYRRLNFRASTFVTFFVISSDEIRYAEPLSTVSICFHALLLQAALLDLSRLRLSLGIPLAHSHVTFQAAFAAIAFHCSIHSHLSKSWFAQSSTQQLHGAAKDTNLCQGRGSSRNQRWVDRADAAWGSRRRKPATVYRPIPQLRLTMAQSSQPAAGARSGP